MGPPQTATAEHAASIVEPSGSDAAVPWHALRPEEALQKLGSTSAQGLSTSEANARLQKYGKNEIQRKQADSALVVFVRQFKNPLLYVLLGSGTLAVAMGKVLDGIVVLAVVLLNAVIGFVQEYRAGRAIQALSQMVPELATTVRAGQKRQVAAEELVPGDIIQLASGDRVPADARLLSGRGLQVQEATLTGESLPSVKDVQKLAPDTELGDRANMLFGGTLVAAGVAEALVVETGQRTQLGRISELLHGAVEVETPLTKALGQISKYLTIAIGVVSVVLLIVGVVRGYALADAVLAAITLAVAAIPEGLPAIVTIALAIGVQRMAKRNAVIRRLPAVETLGSTSVICSDKTGTLTRNEMTVQALWTVEGVRYRLTGVGYEPRGELVRDDKQLEQPPEDALRLISAGALCNDASLNQNEGRWLISGDPTEGGLIVAAEKVGAKLDTLRRDLPRIDVIPFESEHQFMATLHQDGANGRVVFMKGAPEVVFARCEGGPSSELLKQQVDELASEGMRVLAVAEKPLAADALRDEDVEGGFRLLGLIAMIDPPREEAIAAVKACHDAGIIVKMITGDHRKTAEAIAGQLGILNDQRSVSGAELSRTSDEQLKAISQKSNVFARVAPEHKLRLVKALQAQRQVVAMTGDGVNDAPALKQADIGVAMGITGTSVSKDAADVVLADDNFASIAAAVEEGRRVYDNLVKSLAFVLPTNLGLALILVSAVAFFPMATGESGQAPLLPMLPVQLLWINLVAAVALALPLAFEAKEPNVMGRPPRGADEPVLSRFIVMRTVLVAILMTAVALALFLWEYRLEEARVGHELALREAQTMTVTAVIFFQVFYLINCRSLRDSVFSIGLFSNLTVYVGIAVLALAQAAFVYLPPLQHVFGTAALDVKTLSIAALSGAVILPVVSLEKWLRHRNDER
jgi:magnesium-transporting ATPase (P-type)